MSAPSARPPWSPRPQISAIIGPFVWLATWALVCTLAWSTALAQSPPPSRPPTSVPAPTTPAPAPAPTLSVPLPAGDDVSVAVQAPEAVLHVADHATLLYELHHPGYVFEEPPFRSLDAGRIRVLQVQHTHTADQAGAVERYVVTVTLFHVGRFYFPAVPFVYTDSGGTRRTLSSKSASLKVATLVLEDDPTPRPPPGPVALREPDERWSFAAAIAAGCLVLLSLGALLARRYRHRPKPAPPAVPRRAPWEIALERLAALQASMPHAPDARRELFFELSEVMRDYLGARYGFDALEMTTSELLDHLRGVALPRQLERMTLEHFLLDCDLVKFARYVASIDETTHTLKYAVGVVETTQPFNSRPIDASTGDARV